MLDWFKFLEMNSILFLLLLITANMLYAQTPTADGAFAQFKMLKIYNQLV